MAAEAQAKGSFESACEDYHKSLEIPMDTCVQNFVNDKVMKYTCTYHWEYMYMYMYKGIYTMFCH